MSSVLHPVGPEPEQTYWARRVAVLLSLVVVVGVLAALIVSALNTGSAVSAGPVPPPVAAAPVTSSLSPAASPSPSVSTSPSPSASASASARSGASPTPAAEGRAARKPATRKTATTAPVACAPAKLRTTLTGRQTLKPKQDNQFTLSLINGSDATCTVSVAGKNFELKIYSGTDRIWTSKDCSTAIKPVSRKVRAEDAVEWTMTWDGNRSRRDCKDRPEVPRAGTYFATAQLAGAKPVQLRMILRG